MNTNFSKKEVEKEDFSLFSDTGSSVFDQTVQETEANLTDLEPNEPILYQNDPFSSETKEEEPKNSDFNTNIAEKPTDYSVFFSEKEEKELKESFPTVNVEKLKNNKDFCSLLSAIMENPSLGKIYSCVNAIVAKEEAKSRQRAVQALANAKSSVGSLSSAQENIDVFFTKEQVLQMSPEQIRKHYSKIRQSQQSW